jgi:hypothetical protein
MEDIKYPRCKLYKDDKLVWDKVIPPSLLYILIPFKDAAEYQGKSRVEVYYEETLIMEKDFL